MGKSIRIYVNSDLKTDQRLHRAALSLHNAGFDVTVIGRRLARIQPLEHVPYRVGYIKTLVSGGPISYLLYNVRIFMSILFSRVSAIYANDLDTLPGCCLGATLRFKPLIYDSHELFTEVPELIDSPLKRLTWRVAEQICIRKAGLTIAVSESIAAELGRRYGVCPVVVRNVPIRRTVGTPKADRPTLIYQGSLNMGRGIELAIDTMGHLPNHRLIIAGGGYAERSLRERVLKRQLAERVEFVGRLSPNELHRVTCTAWLGLSLEEDMGLNYRFALPNKVFDYVAAQIPVMVSDLPEMSRAVEGYGIGLVAKSREPGELAAQIAVFLADSTLYAETLSNVQRASEELHWGREEQKLLAPVRQMLNPREGA